MFLKLLFQNLILNIWPKQFTYTERLFYNCKFLI